MTMAGFAIQLGQLSQQYQSNAELNKCSEACPGPRAGLQAALLCICMSLHLIWPHNMYGKRLVSCNALASHECTECLEKFKLARFHHCLVGLQGMPHMLLTSLNLLTRVLFLLPSFLPRCCHLSLPLLEDHSGPQRYLDPPSEPPSNAAEAR